MELKKYTAQIKVWIEKYKYVILVLLIGIVLMCVPFNASDHNDNNVDSESAEHMESKSYKAILAEILSLVDGAGTVEVMLTTSKGEETLYQEDINRNQDAECEELSSHTVIITDGDRNQRGLIKQVIQPVYLGAIIVCEGADDPAVKLAIVDAVSKVTGLGADRICVLKMK